MMDPSGDNDNSINIEVVETRAKATGDVSPETKETVKLLKRWLLAAGVLIFFLCCIVGGLVVGIVAPYKDSYVKGSGTLSDGDGHVVMTAPAIIGLPLIVAPVLDGTRLAAINEVSVKTSNCPDEGEIERFLKVESIERHNNTAVVFHMANNEAVYVWNGATFFVDANSTAYPVCKATATCAALYVDDKGEKEELEEKTYAALVAGGFVEYDIKAVEQRRLLADFDFTEFFELFLKTSGLYCFTCFGPNEIAPGLFFSHPGKCRHCPGNMPLTHDAF